MSATTNAAPTLVSAAVLLRCGAGDKNYGNDYDEFLLARRPPGKVYAGWWEFPGGKVEAGETFHDALLRELDEELGIRITAATPWLTREFVYPHATVRIRFFRVTAWDGEIHAHAHDAWAWQRCGGEADVSPILPANGPILKGLALPTCCALSNAEENGIEAELQRLRGAVAAGLRLLQIRDKRLPPAERERFARTVMAIARPAGTLVFVNDDAALAQRLGADGLHLSAATLARAATRPDFAWVGASCHDAGELAQAAALGCDYALLGPVLPTPTHPDRPGLGWEAAERLIAASPLPVFALGGMSMERESIEEAWRRGAHGVALLRGWN